MRRMLLVAAATFAMGLGTAHAAGPQGTWLTESGETKVKIQPCGGGLCGDIVWVQGDKGQPYVGKRMLTMQPDGSNAWSGKLTNYKDGKTYTGKLSMQSDNKIKLSGCVLGGLFCRSQVWTRTK